MWQLFHHRYHGILTSAITIPVVLPYHGYHTRGNYHRIIPIPAIINAVLPLFPDYHVISNLQRHFRYM